MKRIVCFLLSMLLLLGGTVAMAQSDTIPPSSSQPSRISAGTVAVVDGTGETTVDEAVLALVLPELFEEEDPSIVDQMLQKKIADKKDDLKDVELEDVIDAEAQDEIQKQAGEEPIEWDQYQLAELWRMVLENDQIPAAELKASFAFEVSYEDAALMALIGFVEKETINWTVMDVEAQGKEITIRLPKESVENLLASGEAVFVLLKGASQIA